MTSEQKITWTVMAVVTAGLALFLVVPRVGERLAPEPVAAWVAIEPVGAAAADVGPVDLAAGAGFRLHAVLEARGRDGSSTYYTEAPALVVGGQPVPAEAVRRWGRGRTVKVLWFTVEGFTPYLELDPGEGLDKFRFEAFFRPEWGFGWSIPGILEPANDDRIGAENRLPRLDFGTQRYQVRVELYEPGQETLPASRFVSPGPAPPGELAAVAGPSRVTASLPGAVGPASAVFGLTAIAPPTGGGLTPELVEWTRQRIAFSRVPLLAAVIEGAGRAPATLGWRRTALDGSLGWGSEVAAGDMVQVGDRAVVLYRDAEGEGMPGRLDRADLCFDYVRGAAVRPLGTVFAELVGEEGEVEWVSLNPPAP